MRTLEDRIFFLNLRVRPRINLSLKDIKSLYNKCLVWLCWQSEADLSLPAKMGWIGLSLIQGGARPSIHSRKETAMRRSSATFTQFSSMFALGLISDIDAWPADVADRPKADIDRLLLTSALTSIDCWDRSGQPLNRLRWPSGILGLIPTHQCYFG